MRDHYSADYNNRLEQHRKALSHDLAGLPSARFKNMKQLAHSRIDSGKAQVDQGQKQLDSARAQLADANKQLADGSGQIENAKSELAEQVAAAQSQIAAGQAQVQSGQSQYDAEKQQYDAKTSQVAAARAQVNDGYHRINQSQASVDDNVAKLEGAKKQYDDGVAALTQVQSRIQTLQAKASAGTITPNEQAELTALLGQHPAINEELQNAQAARAIFISDTYDPGMEQVTAGRAQIAQKKAEADTANAQVTSAEAQLAQAKSQLDAAAAQLAQGRASVTAGQQQLADNRAQAQSRIDSAQAELDEKTNEYNGKKAEFDKAEPGAKSKIAKAQKKLDDATAMLNAMEEPVYSIDSKREVPGADGYKVYDSVSVIVDSLSRIFPYFMYFVAALVTFTTMTRFVEEERINAGTLKALGYSNRDVMAKFVVYGLAASLTGAAIGIFTGHVLLPIIVYNAYKVGFNVPRIQFGFHWPVTMLAVLLALVSAVLPAIISASRELRDKPAVLMLPKPPSAGSKILLERIPLIWNHLNFTHKVTARNIFRYKQRMFMTIFGVAGSVALLTAGFGVQGSISGISAHQFGDVMHYHLIAAENNHVTDGQHKAIDARLKRGDIERSTAIHYEDVTKVAGRNDDKQDVTLIVPERTTGFNKYVELNTRAGHKPLELEREGAVVSERFANLVGAKKGSTIEVKDAQGATRNIKVTGVCEMYLGHFIFMSPTAYESAFGQDYKPNAHMVNLKDGSVDNTKRQSASFMKLGGIKGVVQNTTLITQIDVVVKALNQIMWVLIIVAVMLGLVILYNLTNLNVAERIRELSTIKVLGFYNGEVTMYIYRETILLSALGILVGYVFGAGLQHYIITAVPPDNVMFDPGIAWPAFVVPLVVVTLITALLGYFVYQRLKHVDMLGALKSVD
jgi:putative ABC transport system permease protein